MIRVRKASNGDAELTNGIYVWPDGLAHYVAEHGVRLPRPMLDHILARTAEFDLGPANYDAAWWKRRSQATESFAHRVVIVAALGARFTRVG